jgi:hypothetical protein
MALWQAGVGNLTLEDDRSFSSLTGRGSAYFIKSFFLTGRTKLDWRDLQHYDVISGAECG